MTPRESVYRSDEEDPENIQKLSSGYSLNEDAKDEVQDNVSVNSKRKKGGQSASKNKAIASSMLSFLF